MDDYALIILICSIVFLIYINSVLVDKAEFMSGTGPEIFQEEGYGERGAYYGIYLEPVYREINTPTIYNI